MLNNVRVLSLCVWPYEGVLMNIYIYFFFKIPFLFGCCRKNEGIGGNFHASVLIYFKLSCLTLSSVFLALTFVCFISLRFFQTYFLYLAILFMGANYVETAPHKWLKISGPGFIFVILLSELMDLIHNWLVKWNVLHFVANLISYVGCKLFRHEMVQLWVASLLAQKQKKKQKKDKFLPFLLIL